MLLENVDGKWDGKDVLDMQIYELVLNAMQHGNGNDPKKKVRVWYKFNDDMGKIFVGDEGAGFIRLEEWNDFYKHRQEAIRSKDFKQMMKYASFRGEKASGKNAGIGLFGAMEYWDSGLIFNAKRNKVAALKRFTA